MKVSDSVSVVKGIGTKKKEALAKLNIETLEDLMNFFPRKYEDRRHVSKIMQAQINEDVLIEATVTAKQPFGSPYNKKRPVRIIIEDNSAALEVIFFNGRFMANLFEVGTEYVFFGKITLNNGRRQMMHPEFHKKGDPEDIRGILPVYPLTEGISQKQMRGYQYLLKDFYAETSEWLPKTIVEENKLCSPAYALENIHFPREERAVLEGRYRLVFEELLTLQTGLFYIKKETSEGKKGIRISKESVSPFLDRLSFSLTPGQEKVWHEIEKDLENTSSMNRLVQGDVGSGKTVIAELAIYKSVKAGFQAVMMAPTELLAKQHLTSLKGDLEPFGMKVELLCSSTKAKDKMKISEELKNGDIDVLVGTHAVIQPGIEFKKLGTVITDEQHRFGVNQRTLLSEKGNNPNVLVMTATPIPRTLAVILYGDLDISIIDTMPKGRKPIRTYLRYNDSRHKVYDFVESQVKEGRQAYVVCPLIEESEVMECKSAEEVYEELKQAYQQLRIALVHGAMKQAEKDSVMEAFGKGEIDVLVSTVVIEVGIDVGNATVMVIENCERFGLAQLHQLRGRVGRSDNQSYCILLCGKESEVSRKRNEIMCSTDDGFTIAEEDLKLRGPGELFGTRQHGIPELHISDLVKHGDILEKVKDVAKDIIDSDPNLLAEENQQLKYRVKKMFGENITLQI